MNSHRHLAAIMFTDIVGYTQLMGEDEEKALELLRKNRKLHQKLIRMRNGKWLKEMGDGTLASFKTISDAIYCAGSLIQSCKEAGIELRIGIHFGEITEEHGDIFGDGVNVASRLEAQAQPAQILASEPVHRNVKNKLGITSTFLEEKDLKNVDETVRVFEVGVDTNLIPKAQTKRSLRRKPLVITIVLALAILIIYSLASYFEIAAPNNKREMAKAIAVLPFDNLSTDEENSHFVDGMTEDIRNNLSEIDGLRVTSRVSSEKYRDSELNATDIAKELNVSYLLEGTVQKSENQVKIHAQLIDPETDDHLWSDTYIRDISRIFQVQSEIAQLISAALNVEIQPDEKKRIETVPTQSLEAYEYYLKGNEYRTKFKEMDSAIFNYKKAIVIDPGFAEAYLGLGKSYHAKTYWSEYFQETFADSLLVYANKALDIDPLMADGHALKGHYYYLRSDFDLSIEAYQQAINLNALKGQFYSALGDNYQAKGDYRKSLANYKLSARLLKGEPEFNSVIKNIISFYRRICDFQKALDVTTQKDNYNSSDSINQVGSFHFVKGEWKEMKNKVLDRCPEGEEISVGCLQMLAWSFMYNKEFDKALTYFEKLNEQYKESGKPLLTSELRYGYTLDQLGRKEEAKKHFDKQIQYGLERIKLLRHDAVISAIAQSDLAQVYAYLGEKEKAYKYLHEMEEKEFQGWQFLFFKSNPMMESLWADDEFQQIMKRQDEKYARIRADIERFEQEEQLN